MKLLHLGFRREYQDVQGHFDRLLTVNVRPLDYLSLGRLCQWKPLIEVKMKCTLLVDGLAGPRPSKGGMFVPPHFSGSSGKLEGIGMATSVEPDGDAICAEDLR